MEMTLLVGAEHRPLTASVGVTLLEALQAAHIGMPAPCGGRGLCGKCAVTILSDGKEESVLACRTFCRDGMVVQLPEVSALTVELGQSDLVLPDPGLAGYGVACDVGTTTVVCHLLDLTSGRVLTSLGAENRQRVYGADVISRIQASKEGKRPALTAAIRGEIADMILTMCWQAKVNVSDVHAMAVVGNTTMCHLLAGLAPDAMGTAPFEPLSRFGDMLDASAMGMPFRGSVYMAPAVSGYVGGDITADLLAMCFDKAKKPALLIDVGTNGEMALGYGSKIFCCAVAAGPAFEGAEIQCGMTAAPGAVSGVCLENGSLRMNVIGGGEADGICGSGLIDAVAVMLDMRVLDATGRLLGMEEGADIISPEAMPHLCEMHGENAFCLTPKVYITQSDVRKLQLAKGAVAAGIELLRASCSTLEPISRLLLAGGFGSYISPKSAARIGLIPADLLRAAVPVGNAAARGAMLALCEQSARERLAWLRDHMHYIELSGSSAFADAFLRAMSFPES